MQTLCDINIPLKKDCEQRVHALVSQKKMAKRRRSRSRSRERDFELPSRDTRRQSKDYRWSVSKRNDRSRKQRYNKREHNVQCAQRIPRRFERRWTKREIHERSGKRGATLSAIDREKFIREFPHLELFRHRCMGQRDRELYLHNPHCRQVFASFRHPVETRRFSRILDDKSPRMRYQRRRNEWKTTEHWGQRKLLMSEIEVLTEHAEEGRVVVYAGAAPGDHTNFLSELFPQLTFVLVDPSPFTTKPSDKITIIEDFFTDEVAESFATDEYKDRVLFISDIRSFDSTQDDAEKEERVEIDMQMQQRWVETIQPVASMLKLRFPYKPGKTTYLDGDIYLPVWGPRTTSEARLISTKPYTKRTYDHNHYEDGMYAHNAVVRSSYHNVPDKYLQLGVGYDRCYDCMAEIHIIERYLEKAEHLEDEARSFLGLVERIDKECSKSGRTLLVKKDIDDYVWQEAGVY